MGRRGPSSQEVISTHPIGRVLGIPAKGQRDRRLAIAGYGLIVATAFTTLTLTSISDDRPAASGRGDVGGPETETYRATHDPGYMPTYLDGGGGIAGVPLTEEQRKALIREAMRRGMSERDAYSLAYGDNATIHTAPDGTVHAHPEDVVVPNHPVFIKAAPAELKGYSGGADPVLKGGKGASAAGGGTKTSGDSSSAAKKPGKAAGETGKTKPKDKGKSAPSAGTTSDEPYYPTSGEKVYEDENELKEVLPDPLEEVVDQVGVFSLWLDTTSPGTPQSVGLVEAEGNRLTMTVEAPLAHDLEVTTTVRASLNDEPGVEHVVTTVVTRNDTGEVLAKETGACLNPHAVSALAIEQTVDAVLEAREDAFTTATEQAQ
ncbi:hypothetical protein [Streptomyces sp. NPDC000229]|uniref:hypothetical protein n=1 Tax=Streptomyces sp. NPDC000229 TaxID=3154247 RepID=UPI0033167B8C